MRAAIAVIFLTLIAACGWPKESVVDAHPAAGAQLAVEGVANVELFCVGASIGSVIGPSAADRVQAAEAYANEQRWTYADVVEQGQNNGRTLFVFLTEDGEPTAEVLVARSNRNRGAELVDDDRGWRVWAMQACQ